MDLSTLDPIITAVEQALAELGGLSAYAIAARLREQNIRGGHLAYDCPIRGYLVARTGLTPPWRLSVGGTTWSAYRLTDAEHYIEEGGYSGDVPRSVQQFITAHDAHSDDTADLCNADHRGDLTPWVTGGGST